MKTLGVLTKTEILLISYRLNSLLMLIWHDIQMNALTGTLTGDEYLDPELAKFYCLRSRMLDCFAGIESAVLNYAIKNSQKECCPTAPLGHKVEAARKVPAGPKRSKELKARADAELAKLAALLPERASMVHSRMEIAITTSSEFIAIFRNAKDAHAGSHEALVFEKKALESFVSELGVLEKSLSKALNAENPPPPKPPKQNEKA